MKYTKSGLLLLVSFVLSACAGTEIAIDPPVVSLKKVDVTDEIGRASCRERV